MRNTTAKIVLAVATAGLVATAAGAHPRLRAATPAAGAVLRTAPSEIRMTFSEGLIARFSGVQLKDNRGATIATGPAALAPSDNTRLVVPIRARLAAGTYQVSWHAVSVDTHRVSGGYAFRVAR